MRRVNDDILIHQRNIYGLPGLASCSDASIHLQHLFSYLKSVASKYRPVMGTYINHYKINNNSSSK